MHCNNNNNETHVEALMQTRKVNKAATTAATDIITLNYNERKKRRDIAPEVWML